MKRKTIKYIDDKYFSYGDTILCIDDITDFFIKQNNLAIDVVSHFNIGSVSGLYQILKHYNVKKPSKKRGETITKGCLEKYGVKRAICLSEYKEKSKQTCLKKYGYEFSLQVPEIREKIKETCIDKYGVDNPFKSKQIRIKEMQTWLRKYGVDNPFKSKEIKEKIDDYYKLNHQCSHSDYIFKRMKENNSYGKSKPEEIFYAKLLTIFNKEDIDRQHKDIKYPYHCDFYIKPLNTYIELNFNWTHGNHRFNIENLEDLKILNEWKEKAKSSQYYQSAIYAWTELDAKKFKIAEKNKLNYFTLYSEEEANLLLNQLKIIILNNK